MKKVLLTGIAFTALVLSSALFAQLREGEDADLFNLRTMKGSLVSIEEQIKEKPVLISFFFTECEACKKEIPELNALDKKYKDKVKMYLVGNSFKTKMFSKDPVDAIEDIREYLKKIGNIDMEVLVDKHKQIRSKYKITTYPTIFIVGKDKKVKLTCSGYKKENMAKVEQVIEQLLVEPAVVPAKKDARSVKKATPGKK